MNAWFCASVPAKEESMIRKMIGVAGAMLTLGIAAPALADHYPPDDHAQYHQERAEEHMLEHDQLEAQHDEAHRSLAEEHARMHAEGWAEDPYMHWRMHRRLAR